MIPGRCRLNPKQMPGPRQGVPSKRNDPPGCASPPAQETTLNPSWKMPECVKGPRDVRLSFIHLVFLGSEDVPLKAIGLGTLEAMWRSEGPHAAGHSHGPGLRVGRAVGDAAAFTGAGA